MEKFLLLFMCCLAGVQETVSQTVDWCALPCGKEKNTMCKYKPQKNSGECSNIKQATTKVLRKDILHLHNQYRDKIANGETQSNGVTWPKASNMRQMSWDNDLEKLAYRWAQQCFASPPHDKCRRTPAFKYNGQNKGWSAHSNGFPPMEGSFEGWVGEIQLATPGIVDNLGNVGGVLHFTQVIWAESYKLGCAAIHADQRGLKSTTLVCNYGPGGNMIGGKIYSRGDPCTSCPAQTSCKPDSTYTHLCAAENDPRKPEDIPDPPDINGSCKSLLFGMRPENSKILISSLSFLNFLTILNFLGLK